MRSSRIGLPAESLALARAAGVERAVRSLDQVCELRVDVERRRDLHLSVVAYVDRKLGTNALTSALAERPDLLLGVVGGTRILACRRDRSRILMGRILRRDVRSGRAGVVRRQNGFAAIGGQDAEGIAGLGRRDGVVDVGLSKLRSRGRAVETLRHRRLVKGDGTVGANLACGDSPAAIPEDVALEEKSVIALDSSNYKTYCYEVEPSQDEN